MSAKVEYRVVYRRSDRLRSEVYQTRRAAERRVLLLQGRMQELTGLNPDDYACCPGTAYDACGCGGEKWGERWEAKSRDINEHCPLQSEPRIESREVGGWAAA